MNFYKITTLAIFSMLLVGCKSLKETADTPPLDMPDQFDLEGNFIVTDQPLPLWREFYRDSALVNFLDSALSNNYDLQIASQRIMMSQAQLMYAKGQNKPFVTGGIEAGQVRFGKYTMDGVGNFDTNFSPNIEEAQKIPRDLPDLFMGVHSSWEIDVWGRLKNMRKSAASRFLASEEGRKWTQTQLVADIASLYYDLQAMQQQIELLDTTRVLQARALEIIKMQKDAGNANELAVNQLQAQYYNFQAQAVSVQQQKQLLENEINRLMGRFPEVLSVPVTNRVMDSAHLLHVLPRVDILHRRPDIREAELNLLASKADVTVARAALYPTLMANGTLGLQSFRSAQWLNTQSLTYRIFGSLFAPLINRSEIKANIVFQEASQQKAYLTYQQTMLNAFVEVQNELINMDKLGTILQIKTQEAQALSRAANTSTQLFLTGRANYLEIIVAQKNALQAQVELIETKRAYNLAHVALYRALGGG